MGVTDSLSCSVKVFLYDYHKSKIQNAAGSGKGEHKHNRGLQSSLAEFVSLKAALCSWDWRASGKKSVLLLLAWLFAARSLKLEAQQAMWIQPHWQPPV